MFELSLKIWHHWNWESSFITVHVRQVLWIKRVNQKIGSTKETHSFRFDCFVGHVSKNRWSKCIQHRKSHCFFQTSLKRFAADPLVLLYKQNTIEPNNKAIIFIPKRTCVMQDRYSTIGLISTYLHPSSKGTELRELVTCWNSRKMTTHYILVGISIKLIALSRTSGMTSWYMRRSRTFNQTYPPLKGQMVTLPSIGYYVPQCKNLNEPSTQLSEFQILFAPLTNRSHKAQNQVS